MAAEEVRYRKLPGIGYRRLVPSWALILLFFVIGIFVLLLRGKRAELWLGPDHLLLVEWDGSREYYRRLYYRDIQAVVVRRTSEWVAISVVLGALAIFFAALAASLAPAPSLYLPLVLAAVCALIMAVYLAGGPTCNCHLRTAVQTVDLVSLRRLRHARKMLDLLRPEIEEAQGRITVEDLAARLQNPAT